MTTTELLKVFLKDPLVFDKYGISPAKAEAMKFNDECSVLFVNVLKECLREYDKKNARASTNLKNYVELKITEEDMPTNKNHNSVNEID